MDEAIKTWGQALDYTFRTRHSWRHGNGAKTAAINSGHFTRLRGRSFPIGKINQQCITHVSIELEDEGKSDATINRVVSAVSTVLNHCAFDECIPAAPRLRRRKEGESRRAYFTKDQHQQFLQGCLDPFERRDLWDISMVAPYTGMRRGELLQLRARDVDLGANLIHVGGLPDFQTKANNYRTIPMHEAIITIMRERLEHASPSTRVFDDWSSGDCLMRAFRKVHKWCQFDERLCFHSFRHSFCTWLAESGVPMLTIKELAGHKRIETTLIYAKVTDKARTEALQLI